MRGLDRLRGAVGDLERAVVAFSGGVDSSLLAWAAHDTLGRDAALAVTAVSPSLAQGERQECAETAASLGLRWREVVTHEMELAAYRRNDPDRCYWCKDALMEALGPLADEERAVVALGVNLDDLAEHRPGQRAAAERGARFPLVEAGLAKADVRRLAREVGLPTADKPAQPCLASRLPHGTEVSVGALGQVERAEARLRALGFGEVRVRHYGDLARVEVPLGDLDRLLGVRGQAVDAVRAAGYRYVTLDLDGLRSGNLSPAPGA